MKKNLDKKNKPEKNTGHVFIYFINSLILLYIMIIEIDGKYIDTKKLIKEQILLKKIILYEIGELLRKFGFRGKQGCYYNPKTLQKVRIRIEKKL